MKEVITIKMVEQTTTKYIAEDGKEFTSESECINYEFEKKRKEFEKEFKKLDKQKLYIPVAEDYLCDGSIDLIILNSKLDVDRIYNFYKSYKYSDLSQIETLYKITDFPKKIILVDNGYDYCWLYNIDMFVKDLQKIINCINGEKEIISNT